MEKNQEPTAANVGGKYYPRKMRTGWCVAHRITACGVTIERFGVKSQTYREAFVRAEQMNLEEAEASAAEHAGGIRKEVQV